MIAIFKLSPSVWDDPDVRRANVSNGATGCKPVIAVPPGGADTGKPPPRTPDAPLAAGPALEGERTPPCVAGAPPL